MKSLPKALQVDSVMTRKLHPLLQLITLIPSATANKHRTLSSVKYFISSDENKPPKLIQSYSYIYF